ncbi:DUF1648 domain-containing protein [Kineococcus sp. SYSU DK004]|uniref:DUF1648 domain-containing protein n=1 Tax=Kineococcus sp. SYSU DK004 TaxID=3383125 RepID=UPI003D7DD556
MGRERLFWVSVVLFAGVLALSAVLLPERVPLHFGAGGDVDRWGTRAQALTLDVLVGGGTVALLAVLVLTAHRLPLEWVNVPHKDVWSAPEHEPELRRRLREDLAEFGAATVLLLAVVVVLAPLHAARTGTGQLPWWAVAAFALYLAYAVLFGVRNVRTRYRPPSG